MIVSQTKNGSANSAVIFGILAVILGGAGGLMVARIPELFILVAAVLGIVALILSVWRIELGLLVLVVVTYTRLSDVLIKFHGAPSIMQAFVPLLLVVILIRWLLFGERPRGWARSGFVIAAYGLVGFSSLLYAPYFSNTMQGISYFVRDVIIAIVAVTLIHTTVTYRRAIWALLIAGIFLGTLSVFQQLTGTFTNNYLGFAQAGLQAILGVKEGYRIGGPVADPNFFGQIMLVMIPLALDRLRAERSVTLLILAVWALVVSSLTVVFTFSRAAFMGLFVVLALTLFRRRPRVVTLLVAVVVFIIVLQFVPPLYTERMATLLDFVPGLGSDNAMSDSAFEDRASAWGVAWLMFRDSPLVGVGYGNYEQLYPEYSVRFGLEPARGHASTHSLYMEILAETGLVGLAFFIVVIVVMFNSMAEAVRTLREVGKTEVAATVLAFRTAMIGYMFVAAFLHDAFPRYFWLLFGIAMASLNVARTELEAYRERRPYGG